MVNDMNDRLLSSEDLGRNEYMRYFVGLYSMGCTSMDIHGMNIRFKISDNTLELLLDDEKIIMSSTKIDNGVWLNDKRGERYIHRILSDGRVISAYMTSKMLDKYLLAGIITCLKKHGLLLSRAVDEALQYLSLGDGNPFSYLNKVLHDYRCYMRVLNAIERILGNKLIDKLAESVVSIGCRGHHSNNVFLSEIHNINGNYIASIIKPYSIELHDEYKVFRKGSGFICLDKDINIDVEKYGYVIIELGKSKCIVGEDPVKLVILFEKIFPD